MRVSGLHQLSKHYNKPLTVELQSALADGSKFAVRLQQVRPLVYMALGRSIPITSGKRGREMTAEELKDWHLWKRDLVSQCLVAFRSVVQETGSDEWKECWEPVSVVKKDPDRENGEIVIDDFDFLDNVDRCVVALMDEANSGGIFDEFKDANFRPERFDSNGVVGEKLQSPSA